MGSLRRIIVALNDLRARQPAVLERAAQLARGAGAQLELFHALSTPVFTDTMIGANQPLQSYTGNLRALALRRLERLAEPLRRRGLRVGTHADWDYPPYEAIVRRAVSRRADLIVAARHGHHRFPALMGDTDWQLLRASPVPILLVRARRARHGASVVAALDPWHANAKPSGLDRRILDVAAGVSEALRAPLHVVHVLAPWQPLPVQPDGPQQARAATMALARLSGLRSARIHVPRGPVTEKLPSSVHALRGSVLVMGDMSRRGLQRWFVGDTAERVVDAVRCDVLVVKPTGFAMRLPRRTRGVYWMTNLPYA